MIVTIFFKLINWLMQPPVMSSELLSFMDVFFNYNQLQMVLEDKENIAFITDHGLYYYKVIHFRLKNAGATYMHLVNKIFKDHIGCNIEIYVDDMLLKAGPL